MFEMKQSVMKRCTNIIMETLMTAIKVLLTNVGIKLAGMAIPRPV
jgi:hypothetical protein